MFKTEEREERGKERGEGREEHLNQAVPAAPLLRGARPPVRRGGRRDGGLWSPWAWVPCASHSEHLIMRSVTLMSKDVCFSYEIHKANQLLHLVLNQRNSHLFPVGKENWLNWNFDRSYCMVEKCIGNLGIFMSNPDYTE